MGVVNSQGRHHQLKNLSIFDGSVFPTSLGVNPQLSIYGLVAQNATALAATLKVRILLVEDDAMLGETLQSALEPQGYTVDWLRDGQQALHALSDQHFDLVILDLGLPKIDGMSVLKA
jgi:hypothetical protein